MSFESQLVPKRSYHSAKRKRLARRKMLERFKSSHLAPLIALAKKKGLKVRPDFANKGKGGFRQRKVYIGHKLCKVSFVPNPCENSKYGKSYWRPATFRNLEVDFVIIQTGDGTKYPLKFFVIPVREARVRRNIYIPLSNPKSYWWQFEDRWDLLKD